MAFENIIGQQRVIDILSTAIKNDRFPHALLFHGPEGVGKTALALASAKALLCQNDQLYCDQCSDCKRINKLSHPDVMLIFPSPKEPKVEEVLTIKQSIIDDPYFRTQLWAKPYILIESIRQLKKTISMKSYENKGRVVILLDVHRLWMNAANSFLKILEEPPGKVTFILITDQPNALLPTIISRCQQVRFDPLSWDAIKTALENRKGIDPLQADKISRMSLGNYHRALELIDEDMNEKQELMIDLLRNILMNDLDLVLKVESILRENDLKKIKDILALMLMWFRDSMILESFGEVKNYQSKIINIDQIQVLQKFVDTFETINYDVVIGKIEYAISLINRNVYINLILLQLVYELKKLLRRKGNV